MTRRSSRHARLEENTKDQVFVNNMATGAKVPRWMLAVRSDRVD